MSSLTASWVGESVGARLRDKSLLVVEMWGLNVLIVMMVVVTSSSCQQTCVFGDTWWSLNEDKSYLQCEINKSKILNRKSIEQQILINREKQTSRITILVCNFLAILLLISALIAVFEVCRDRYYKQDRLTSASCGTPELRRCSLVDLTVSRHARRSVDHPARLTKDHRSLSVQNRPLLGARPPPLIRRSSFPVQVTRDSGSPGGGTPAQESNEGTPHRIRLIRRH